MSTTEVNMLKLNSPVKKKTSVNSRIIIISVLVFVFGFFFLGSTVSYKHATLYVIAGVLGLTLYHAHYGFTSSFRSFLVSGRGLGIRTQMIMFLLANLLFLPILLGVGGAQAEGFVSPVGMSVLIGVFIFGIGMHLGDGSAFALWGAKISQSLGIPVTDWGYWQTKSNAAALNNNIFKDITSVMDLGVMLGALLALGLSGRPNRFLQRIPLRMVAGLLFGGVLMGYGARIAFGCNIGAYFGGIASFSFHGWLWIIGAMLGSIIGVKLRPICAFGRK
jgi:uncharacterized membrane protein YedE/YeeE